jgi:hypothetical protein
LAAAGARAALMQALRAVGDELDGGDERRDTLDVALERLAALPDLSAAALGGRLAALGDDAREHAALTDLLGLAARTLAPDGDEVAATGASAAAWRALSIAVDRLHSSGAVALGRLAFLSDALIDGLVREAREKLPERPGDGERLYAVAGPLLARLAVSRQLKDALRAAYGAALEPSYDAVYMYDPPGSHVRTHVDNRAYELIWHLVLEHTLPADGSGGSALVTHPPDSTRADRLALAPADSVLLHGRGTLHSWQPLRAGERRTLIGVGYTPHPDED